MPQAQTDHDILIRLDERVDGLHQKLDKLTNDHEDRIRALERKAERWVGKQGLFATFVSSAVVIIAAIIQSGHA